MVGVKYEGSWILPSAPARNLKFGIRLTGKGLHMGVACNMSRRFWDQ